MVTMATIGRNAAVDGVAPLANSGFLNFHNSSNQTIVKATMNATAFGAASSGTATANSLTEGTCVLAGTIDHCHFEKSDSSEIASLTVTASGGGGDIELSSLTWAVSDVVRITSLTLSQDAT